MLSDADKLNSTRHYFRELSRFGLTSATDARRTGTPYPGDYRAMATVAGRPKFPMRVANLLFAQRPGTEREFYEKLSEEEKRNVNRAASSLNGYVFEGAGEVLVWSAADFEDFMAARPELKPEMERELAEVTPIVAKKQWPIRQHATYDQSISRILDVFEPIFKETGYHGRWGIDHCRNHHAAQHRAHQSDGRRHRGPGPLGIRGRIFRGALRSGGRVTRATHPADARCGIMSAPERMQPAWRATIRGSRFTGW